MLLMAGFVVREATVANPLLGLAVPAPSPLPAPIA